MRKTRKRARRALSLVWACALARLEDRLLLSGASYATEVVPIPPAGTMASVEQDAPTSPSDVPSVPPPDDYGIGDASTSLGGYAGLTIDPSEGGAPVEVTFGSSVAPPSSGGNPSGVSFTAIPGGVGIPPTAFGPNAYSIDPSGGGAPVGPITIGPGDQDPQVGEGAGRRVEAIEAGGGGTIVVYLYSSGSFGTDGTDILAMADDARGGDAAPALGGTADGVPDLADPPPVPQPTTPQALPFRVYLVPEVAEADPDGPPAAEGEPETTTPPAAPEAPAPEETPPAEAPIDPIAAGLRLSAPPVDVSGWDEALGRLVEGVDDLTAGLRDLGTKPATMPWVVAAGLMLVASEAARRVRYRPRLAAGFVDGSASVVDPADEPCDRPRAQPLGSSVRRLVARGLSRWTTRR